MSFLLLALATLCSSTELVKGFDRTLPGDQRLFLAPSGYVIALQRTGGLPATGAPTVPARFSTAGEIVLGGIHPWNTADSTWAAPIMKGSQTILRIRSYGRNKGFFGGGDSMTLDQSVTMPTWAGDTLLYLTNGRLMELYRANGWFQKTDSGGSWLGLQGWKQGNRWLGLVWDANQVKARVPSKSTGKDTLLRSSVSGTTSAGLWKDGTGWKLVRVYGANKVEWGNGTTDSVPGPSGVLVQDAFDGAVLFWQAATGDLWRLRPGSRQRLVTAAGGLYPAGGGNPNWLVLGGNLASGVNLKTTGVVHLGDFHQSSGAGIATLRVDPVIWSPVVGPSLKITASLLGQGDLGWTMTVRGPKGFNSQIASGTGSPSGFLSQTWNGGTASNGKYRLVLRVVQSIDTAIDSVGFELDKTPPVAVATWTGSGPIGPGHTWTWNLAGVVDDQDTARAALVELWLQERTTGRVIRWNLDPRKIPGRKWTFDGRDPDGSWIPEGDWRVKWLAIDTAGNKSDTVRGTGLTDSLLRIRRAGPSLIAKFSPLLVPTGEAVEGWLDVDISGSPNAYVQMAIINPLGAKIDSLSATLNTSGKATVRRLVKSVALASGEQSWKVRGYEAGWLSTASAVFFVGKLLPSITSPTDAEVVYASGLREIRGIAPDPDPSGTSDAIFRVALHPGNWVAQASPKWQDLGRSGARLLPVTAATSATGAVTARNRSAFDLVGVPGSIGQANRLGSEEVLAVLDASKLTDSVYTLSLWVGKGDSVKVATRKIRVQRTRDSTGTNLSLALLRPSTPAIDRRDADTLNDLLKIVASVDPVSGAEIEWQVWAKNGSDVAQPVWRKSASTTNGRDTLVFLGKNQDNQWIQGDFTILAVAKAGSSRLESRMVGSVNAPLAVAADSTLSVDPDTLDLGLADLGWTLPKIRCSIKLDAPELARIVVTDSAGSVVTVLPGSTDLRQTLSWDGTDSTGVRRVDPNGADRWFAFGLEVLRNDAWSLLDRDTVQIVRTPASLIADSGAFVQGTNQDSLRIADLISDVRIRARLEGPLAYYPDADVRFRLLPEGEQTARLFEKVDYQVEWAKGYNSIAGFQNYSGTWLAQGHRFVWYQYRLRTSYSHPAAEYVPFWFFLHPGMSGIGTRAESIRGQDSLATYSRGEKVGIPLVYKQSGIGEEVQFEAGGNVYHFNSAKFYGDGVNWAFAGGDDFHKSNVGYSGFLGGSPLLQNMRGQENRFNFLEEASKNPSFCKDDTPSEELPTWNAGLRDLRPDPLSAWEEEVFLTMQTRANPDLRRKVDSLTGLGYYCVRASGKNKLTDTLRDSTVHRSIWNPLVAARDSARYDSVARLVDSLSKKHLPISETLDSLASIQMVRLEVSPLEILAYLRSTENVAVKKPGFQEYLDSAAAALSGARWYSGLNVSANFRLDRNKFGNLYDDGHFHLTPAEWNQRFYVLPAGYGKLGADTAGKLLYATQMQSSTRVILDQDWASGQVSSHTNFGDDRMIPENSNNERKRMQRPGDNHWFFTMTNEWFSNDNKGYVFADVNQGIRWTAGNLHGSTSWEGDLTNLGVRSTWAYSVPPRINWMHPWFYLNDPSVTVVKRSLFADADLVEPIEDGLRWDVESSRKTIGGYASFGGYKAGQVGWWYKPSPIAWVDKLDTAQIVNGHIVPRTWPVNKFGDTLTEVDYIQNWGTHGGPGTRTIVNGSESWAHHDLVFQPRLRVDDRTFGVVWDTTKVSWPNVTQDFLAHLDRANLQDIQLVLDSAHFGRTWSIAPAKVGADSLWKPGKPIPTDSMVITVRDLFPGLPDERWAGSVTGRSSHRLYSFVKAASLAWNVQPMDTLGRFIENQQIVSWRLDTTQRDTLRWRSVWTNRDTMVVAAKPRLIARYAYQPTRQELWSSEADSLLKGRGGWVHLSQNFGNRAGGYEPWRSGIALMPVAVEAANLASIPCYKPSVASAFVRARNDASGRCTDSVVLNPNLLATTGDKARWTVELFYPDGQTPNRDFVLRGNPSIQEVALGLAASQSSQRWVRLEGALPRQLVSKAGRGLKILSWKAFGVQDTEWVRLAPPKQLTDSMDLWTAIRRPGELPDQWQVDSASDVVWWNITGRSGKASFVVRITAKDTLTGTLENVWMRKDFVIGTPRSKDSLTLSDAYHRAELKIPADPTNTDYRPVVLHTLAGADLDDLPVPGLKPLGPVISLSPSGMGFSKPASLYYNLTLREILSRMGTILPDSVQTVSLNQIQACTTWVRQNLAIWILSDSKAMEKVPTSFALNRSSSGNSGSADFDKVLLVGLIPHFSTAMVLVGDLSKNLAPHWVSATLVGGRLQVSLDGRGRRQLIGWNLPQVEIRIQPVGTQDSLPASLTKWLLNPRSTGKFDSSIVLDSTLVKAILAGQVQLRARFVDAFASEVILPSAPDRIPAFDRFSFDPRKLSSNCSSKGLFAWNSDAAGAAKIRILSSSGVLVDKFDVPVVEGVNAYPWGSCPSGSSLAKGIYRAEIRAASVTGSVSTAAAKILWIGIDTAAPELVLQSLTPSVVGLADTAAGLLRWKLLALGLKNRTLKVSASRTNDFLETAPVQKWTGTSQVLTSDSVVVEGQWNLFADAAVARAGDWMFNAQVDSLGSQSARFRVVKDSIEASLALSDTVLPKSQARELGIRLWVKDSAIVSAWIRTSAGKLIPLVGTPLMPSKKVESISATWTLPADSLDLGQNTVCALIQGSLGGVRSICRNVRLLDLGPGVTITRAVPGDSLWVGWPDVILAKSNKRMDRVVVEGSSLRSGSALVSVRHKGRVLREDTLSLQPGSFHWTWKPQAGDTRLFQDFAEVRISSLGSQGQALDTQVVVKPLIVTVPKALILPGRKDPTYVRRIQDFLFARGIDARIADTTLLLQYLDASTKGALVLLDSALPPSLWKGKDESPLFRWTQSGGNLVFAGAPAFSARLNSAGTIVRADSTDVLRAQIYGLPQTPSTTKDY
ncbi:MAG TPA: hypothetical protein PKY05_04355, partial [Fibrobacteria bacterium]|nr:hypothetical protein [Fibrobacteria bacterium]